MMPRVVNDFPPIAIDYQPKVLMAGDKTSLKIRLGIPEGFHIMSHQPAEEFLIPTELQVDPVDDIVIGTPSYPPAKEEHVEWSEVTLLTYEGQVEIELPIEAKTEIRETLTLSGRLSFQGCTENQCLPPKQQELKISLTIKGDG